MVLSSLNYSQKKGELLIKRRIKPANVFDLNNITSRGKQNSLTGPDNA